MFRIFFLVLAAIGIALAVAYPFVVQNFGGYELGRHNVYSKSQGFLPVEVELTEKEAPVRVLVDFSTSTKINAVTASAKLGMTVLRNGSRSVQEELEFIHSTPGENSVHSGSFVYRATGGTIHPVGTETYAFAFTLMSGATLNPDDIVMILMASAIEWDPRAQLIGYILLAVGLIGFIIATVGRGKQTELHNPQKWGRGDDD